MSHVNQQMHPSSGETAISRDRYNVMRFWIWGLGVALIGIVLFMVFSQPKLAPPPLPPNEAWREDDLDFTLPSDVVTKLRAKEIETLILVGKDRHIRVTGPDLKRQVVCADIKGTEIVERTPGACRLNGIKPLAFNLIHLLYHNPGGGCTSAGGKLSCP